ncbi:MAG: phage/plasmid primase, P4 family [Smithellaceae bacterium]
MILKDNTAKVSELYNELNQKKQTMSAKLNVNRIQDNAKKQVMLKGNNVFKSRSEADLAFISQLLCQTEGDAEQADILFRKSKLYREKWDEKHSADGKTYGQMTMEKATASYLSQVSEEVRKALENDEQGDANMFIELNRGKLCYDHDESRWYVFGENYWEIDKKKAAIASIQTLIDYYKKEMDRLVQAKSADTSSDESNSVDSIKRIKDRIKKLNAIGRRKRILELSAAGENSLGITGEEWDNKPWEMACLNGLLSLKGKEVAFHKGKPDDYIKTPAPTKWEGIDAKAPVWKKTLKEIFQDDKRLIRHLQKMFGYALTGSCEEHVFNILHGGGRNGKGTIVEMISYVIGELTTPVPVETVLSQANLLSGGAPRADIMKLRGRRIAWASESDEGRRLNASQIKLLTGGDKITARSPFSKEMSTFSPTHTLFLLTNHMPHLDPSDYALWQRIHVFPFMLSFIPSPKEEFEREADRELKEKLKAEAPGILAWLVRGCLAAQKFGLKQPPAVLDAIKSYQHKEDTLGLFIKECCKKSKDKRVGATGLFEAYKTWCKENEHMPVTQAKFGKEMAKRFKRKSSNGIFYLGLRLRRNPV